MKFQELDLDNSLLDALHSMHFEECTPIQEKSIPHLLEGKDVVGIAQTGTGKTAAYLLPTIHRIHNEGMPTDVINCVIMVPTRELAQQIDNQLEAFSYFLPVSGLAVYGGNDAIRYEQEVKSMKLGADILIATPGRLISHLSLGNVDLSHTSIFILDEADRMLDMGFIEDINHIVSYLPTQRQTILFSATMPDEIQSLARRILHNPVSIELAIARPADNIDQMALYCSEAEKTSFVSSLFADKDLKRVIIFSSSKKKVREIAFTLKRKGLNIAEMHSDLEQKERDEVLRQFKNGNIDIIVSTDLLSRGIDIDDIEMVINFDVPRNADDYVHRIGRTARANRYGKAITLVSNTDVIYMSRIEKAIGISLRKEGQVPSNTSSPRPSRGMNQDAHRKKQQQQTIRKEKGHHPHHHNNDKSQHRHFHRHRGNKPLENS